MLIGCVANTGSKSKSKLQFEDEEIRNAEKENKKASIRNEDRSLGVNQTISKFQKFRSVMKKNCNNCHNNQRIGDFSKLISRNDWINSKFVTTDIIKTSNFPFKSSIYNKLKGVTAYGNMPAGARELGVVDRNIVKNWINSLRGEEVIMPNPVEPTKPAEVKFDSKEYYQNNCFGCHNNNKPGRTAVQIKAAIGKYNGMKRFSSLTSVQLNLLEEYLKIKTIPSSPNYLCREDEKIVSPCEMDSAKEASYIKTCSEDRMSFDNGPCRATSCLSSNREYSYSLSNGSCFKSKIEAPLVITNPEFNTYNAEVYLDFSEQSGTIINDISGKDNHGYLRNGVALVAGSKLIFDGENDYVNLGNYDFSGKKLSFATKFKVSNIKNCQYLDCRIFSQASGTSENAHTIMLSTTKKNNKAYLRLRIKINGVTHTIVDDSSEVKDNQSVSVFMSYDGINVKLYKNGRLVKTQFISGSISNDNQNILILGANRSNAERAFKGEVTHFSIHKEVLNLSELNIVMNRKKEDDQPVVIVDPPVIEPPYANLLIGKDIGQVGTKGSVTYSSGAYTLRGSGKDIWGSSDEFYYAYKKVLGNGSVIVQVGSNSNFDEWSKAGLMFRQDLSSSSSYVMNSIVSDNKMFFQQRNYDGQPSETLKTMNAKPKWIKLKRLYNMIYSYYSSDGQEWILYGETSVNFNESIYVGLAYTSHNHSKIGQNIFTGFSIIDDSVENAGPDFDKDGVPDKFDRDDDNDGVLDTGDDYPFDQSRSKKAVFNAKIYYEKNCMSCHPAKKNGASFSELKQSFIDIGAMNYFLTNENLKLSDDNLYEIEYFLKRKVVLPPVSDNNLNAVKRIIPLATRRLVLSKLKYLYVNSNRNSDDTQIENIINLIQSRAGSFGGTCSMFFENCPGEAYANADASNLPKANVIRRGMMTKVCSEITSHDRSIFNVLGRIGMSPSDNITNEKLSRLFGIYNQGREISSNALLDLQNLSTKSRQVGMSQIDLWRFINYAFCISPTFEQF